MNIETARTNNVSMQYFRFGNENGKPFVILPGVAIKSVMGSAELIAAQYAALADHFDMYVIDRRRELPDKYSIIDMAEDTAAVMEHLSLQHSIVYGVSQGGMIAELIAADRPDLVDRLILCSTAPYLDEGSASAIDIWTERAAHKDITGLTEAFAESIYTKSYCEMYRDAFTAFAAAVTEDDLERFIVIAGGTKGFDARDRLPSVKCPVLVIAGSEDRIFAPALSEEIARLTGGTLRIFACQAHGVYDECPDVIGLIKDICI